ncbi:MAG: TIGR00269 family protein [Thermoplasmata archaeon]
MECDLCSREAVTFIRYSGAHLCREHFIDFYEKRVYKEFRKQVDLGRGKKIAVAVSGGKDSIVALRLIHDILKERRDSEVVGVTIDEGIAGYRPSSLDIARSEYERLDLDYKIVSFEDEFDVPLDEMVEEDVGNPCSVCGVFRRWLMNKTAKEFDADVLATGINLDDTAQSLLMNFCRGDMEKMARLGPHEVVKEGLIPRIAPLRRCPENETYLYALLQGMTLHDKECPYAVTALRGLYRDVIGELEDNTPGTKFAMLSSYEKIKYLLSEKYGGGTELARCERCGEPTMEGLCKACELLKNLQG